MSETQPRQRWPVDGSLVVLPAWVVLEARLVGASGGRGARGRITQGLMQKWQRQLGKDYEEERKVWEDYGRDRAACRGSHGWSWAESGQGKQWALMSLRHRSWVPPMDGTTCF